MSLNDFISVITITLALIVLFSSSSRRELKRKLIELNESLRHEDRKIENQMKLLEQRIVDLESKKE